MNERILIIEQDDALREDLALILAAEGHTLLMAGNGAGALARASSTPIDVVLCDSRIEGLDGFDLVPQIARVVPGTPIVLMSDETADDGAMEALRRGVYDHLPKPFKASQVLLAIRRSMESERLRRANQILQRDVDRAVGDRPIVAASPLMIELLEHLERTTAFKTGALVVGETGTGKEVIARAIHLQSPRRGSSFVAVECASGSDAALEMELFGRAASRGARGARAKRGRLAEADGGTLFLDEITSLSPSLQSKLVGALQAEEFVAAGEEKARRIDVRVIGATSRDLEAEMNDGRLDPDLFYQLSGATLRVPALRDRREDIPLLLDHFMARFRKALGKPIRGISDDALERLSSYRWPGNVRELENVIERAVLLADADHITLHELPETIASSEHVAGDSPTEDYSLRRARRNSEAQMIGRALRATDGNRTHAAKLLEISHRALLYKIKEYGLRD